MTGEGPKVPSGGTIQSSPGGGTLSLTLIVILFTNFLKRQLFEFQGWFLCFRDKPNFRRGRGLGWPR